MIPGEIIPLEFHIHHKLDALREKLLEIRLEAQRQFEERLIDKFNGGPVGIDNLSAAIGEEKATIEDVYEPFLIQEGYIQRTARGRIATKIAYEHFGKPWVGTNQKDLF